ncbi:Cell division control protein 7 [Ceratobasidium theobromae]|uniref:non-specific serine/threonine protein kinase n=1 Tax=Ceratobasidium theobromae TaxID=1582974 RepID=A0A5N5QW68_9AGAM|nr:Cell division control protein 7 [Ceratobasidium theobromae]
MATLVHTMSSSQAPHMFSEHPSNPLHVSSSDIANATYVRQARLSMSNKGKKVTRNIYAGATPKGRQRKSRNNRGFGGDESSDGFRVHQVVGDDSEPDLDPGEEELELELDPDDAPMNDLDAAADSTELVEATENVDHLGSSDDGDDDDGIEGQAGFVQPVIEPRLADSNPFYVSDDEEDGGEGDVTVTFPHVPDGSDDDGGDEDAEGEDDEEYLNSKKEETLEVQESEALDGVDDESEDEANTLSNKDEMEQPYIVNEMRQLKERVQGLVGNYELVDRLGEGTFSSVYKAIDLNFDKYDNGEWNSSLGYADYPLVAAQSAPSSKPSQYAPAFHQRGRVFVAIKRIYVTSSPQRIANEIELMEATRGCRHVSQLITAFRDEDQVVCVMPFHRSVDFREYFQTLSMRSLQTYFRHLFRALRDIHARDIVHRDVKPANFLFNPKDGPDGTGWGVLCDFGLAQRVDYPERTQCLHTPPTRKHPHGKYIPQSSHSKQVLDRKLQAIRKRADAGSANVGYKADDHRPRVKANRAGTRGFRAPEVLLKCESQTVALDVWSAGCILLACLSGKFPLFNSNDDTEALAEIAAIVGRDRMVKCALLHNRTFLTNLPSTMHKGQTWADLARKMNPNLDKPPGGASESEKAEHTRLVNGALELLDKCLDLDVTKRITARDALHCEFLRFGRKAGGDGSVRIPSDDLLAPHPPGQGVCAKLHCLDKTSEESGAGQMWCVQLRGGGARLVRGDDPDARCIGREPCHYHVGWGKWGVLETSETAMCVNHF